MPDAPRDADFLPLLPEPPAGPLSFLSDEALDTYAATFERTGMTGAFNRYRAAPFDAVDAADLTGSTIDQPSCFIGGSVDPVRHMIPGGDMYADPGAACTDFRGKTIIDGAGHWVHQEAPDAVNAARPVSAKTSSDISASAALDQTGSPPSWSRVTRRRAAIAGRGSSPSLVDRHPATVVSASSAHSRVTSRIRR